MQKLEAFISRVSRTLAQATAITALLSPHTFAQSITRIESFTPTGSQNNVDQVHVQFSDFMFALGKTDTPTPFQPNACDQYGKGRWLNPKEWVFDFKQKLPVNTVCKYSVASGLKSAKGIAVPAVDSYSFDILPAQLNSTEPGYASTLKDIQTAQVAYGVDPDQAFVFRFNRTIPAADVAKRFEFKVEGRNEPIAIKTLDRKTLKKLYETGTLWGKNDESVHLVQPALEFPNKEFAMVTLHDKMNGRDYYYRTREFFKAEMTCSRDNVRAPCSPVQQIELVFNSPVAVDDIKKLKITSTAKGADSINATVSKSESSESSHEDHAIFKGPFRAGATYKIEVPKGLTDIRGRKLKNIANFPLSFTTDGLPAVAKFPGLFGVIEADNPVLPLSLRNVEKDVKIESGAVVRYAPSENAPAILDWLARVKEQQSRDYGGRERKGRNEAASDYESIFKNYGKEVKGKIEKSSLPSMHESQQAEVIGIPVKKGFYVIEFESKILGTRILDRNTPLYTSSAVLVTDLGVHFKWGQTGQSMVWVTSLKTGKPISGVDVRVEACDGKSLASGKTRDDGTFAIEKLPTDNELERSNGCNYSGAYRGTKIVVLAHKDDDFSFVLNRWQEGLESWRFNVGSSYYHSSNEDIVAHTILARDLLKPGQKVNMKHYLREFHWQGFKAPKAYPKFVVIKHLGSEETWNVPVKFSQLGIATTNWTLPESANLGTYTIGLTNELPKKGSAFHAQVRETATFEVQEFRLPTLGLSMRLPDPITKDLKSPQVSLQGMYLSGGPASRLPVELRFQRRPVQKRSRTFGKFIYSQDEAVKTGIVDQKRSTSYGQSDEDGAGDGEGDEAESSSRRSSNSDNKTDTVLSSKLISKINLDAAGSVFVDLPREVLDTDQDGDVFVAISYSDPNGEIQSMVRSTSVFSRDRYLGIDKDVKLYSSGNPQMSFNFALGGLKGEAVPGQDIQVDLYRRMDYVHREKLVGGFYGYHRTTETKKVGELCKGKTDVLGGYQCKAKMTEPGNYILQVNAQDSHGKALTLVQEVYIYGGSDSASDYSESDRITLVPDKEEYEAGDTAQITLQSPFKDFEAWVTMERGGVMEHQVVALNGDKPVVQVPILAQHSPDVVVSIFAVRGRIGTPEPTGILDLAKPAFKMGMVRLKVGKKSHTLPVKVTTDKPVYQVRDKVAVTIETKPKAEMALAVVDKALLRLKPNLTWDLLNAMITSRPHEVETSTMQMNIVGKRHFGKKATPFGGGGGTLMTREMLDSLVAWLPNLKADADGVIKTGFKLNDAISGFVVVAVGTEGMDFYGTGKTEIAATQDLQIISSVPPTLRERDRLPIQFILCNSTAQTLHVAATLAIDQDAVANAVQQIEVPPQGAKEILWEDKVPMGVRSRVFTLTATSKEGANDKLKVTSKVVEVLPSRVVEGYLQQLGSESKSIPITFPTEAVQDKGGYRVQVQAHLSDVPQSVLDFMDRYPYGCFEQQTSKAITLQDVKGWKKQWKSVASYLDSNALIKYFPEMQYGSVDLTAYVMTIAAEAGKLNPAFQLPTSGPDGVRVQRILEALRKAMRGEIHVTQTWWPAYVGPSSRIVAGEALSYYEPVNVADYEALKAARSKSELHHSLSLQNMLFQSPKSLESVRADISMYGGEILSHYTFENTHLNLKDGQFWFCGSLSASPDGLRARTLRSFVLQDQKDNATKMVRSLFEALKSGYWDTTPGIAWGTVGLTTFRQKYEKTPVSGRVSVGLASISKSAGISEKKQKSEIFVPIAEASKVAGKVLNQKFAGNGAPWSFTLVEAAIPVTAAVDHGFTVSKSVEPVNESKKGKNSRGDLYKVKLVIESKAPQSWVVLLDPIPTGASILSTEASNRAGDVGYASLAFEERRSDRLQVFYEYIPKGKIEFTYTVRLNQLGTFEFPSTRLEAMYDPTQYGESPNTKMEVRE